MSRHLMDIGPKISVYSHDYDTGKIITQLEDAAEFSDVWQAAKHGSAPVTSPYRTSVLASVEQVAESHHGFKESFDHFVGDLEQSIWHYRRTNDVFLTRNEGYSINKYGGGGEYKAHVDSGLGLSRVVSLVAFLNTPGDGGALHFPKFDVTIPAEVGKIVVFPSCDPWVHVALPVESMDDPKYSLVTWFHG